MSEIQNMIIESMQESLPVKKANSNDITKRNIIVEASRKMHAVLNKIESSKDLYEEGDSLFDEIMNLL